MAAIKRKKVERRGLRESERKWGSALIKAGWTLVPNIILERQRGLDLDAVDMNIILHLLKHWWNKERKPHPSKKTIAECMNVSQSTIQRHIAELEKANYIKREIRYDGAGGRASNYYDLSGFKESAEKYAKEHIRLREDLKQEDHARRLRKRPKETIQEE
jgi:predicted transcriptional regulator